MQNFLPKQDIILVKSDDPKLAVSGFWQGMSGSPLYLDDKLLCAFSYGFRFNKVALGGCTPIDYMKRDGDAYRRNVPVAASATRGGPRMVVASSSSSMADWRRLTPNVDVAEALDRARPGPPELAAVRAAAPRAAAAVRGRRRPGDAGVGAALDLRVLGAGVLPAREDVRRLEPGPGPRGRLGRRDERDRPQRSS